MSNQRPVRQQVDEYLSQRRSLGYALKIEGEELIRFADYADRLGEGDPLTVDLAVRWALLPHDADPIYSARRLDMVRRFATWRAVFEPRTQIPPKGYLGPSYRRTPPHIYSEQEIHALLQQASTLGPNGGLRPSTYVTLFGLLVSTGLRISEALALTTEDVDLSRGVLTVRASKFKQSRLVPVHASTTKALRDYDERRARYHGLVPSRAFFLTELATPLKYLPTLLTFTKLRRQLGWETEDGRRPPRIHDLRHTFAVRRLLYWYQQDTDVDRKIHILATYLGHVKVSDTYWYLSAVPELMAIAGKRFEQFSTKMKEEPR
jgi:integrase